MLYEVLLLHDAHLWIRTLFFHIITMKQHKNQFTSYIEEYMYISHTHNKRLYYMLTIFPLKICWYFTMENKNSYSTLLISFLHSSFLHMLKFFRVVTFFQSADPEHIEGNFIIQTKVLNHLLQTSIVCYN